MLHTGVSWAHSLTTELENAHGMRVWLPSRALRAEGAVFSRCDHGAILAAQRQACWGQSVAAAGLLSQGHMHRYLMNKNPILACVCLPCRVSSSAMCEIRPDDRLKPIDTACMDWSGMGTEARTCKLGALLLVTAGGACRFHDHELAYRSD